MVGSIDIYVWLQQVHVRHVLPLLLQFKYLAQARLRLAGLARLVEIEFTIDQHLPTLNITTSLIKWLSQLNQLRWTGQINRWGKKL